MSIEWNKQSFQALREVWQTGESNPDMSDRGIALTDRYEGIQCMVESDHIWPLTSSAARQKFIAALCEVLSRLPGEVFDQVDEMSFILEDPGLDYIAVNVPAPASAADTIVFFRKCLDIGPEAMIGLIAHEIAHSFVGGRDNREDEDLVDKKAREWGFGDELDCLALAKKARPG